MRGPAACKSIFESVTIRFRPFNYHNFRPPMSNRDTTWDEEDTTTGRPLLPHGQPRHQEYLMKVDGVKQLFESGVEGEIKTMTEIRRAVNKIVESMPAIREDQGRIIVPVVYEKMVLVKRLVLVEEIVLSIK